MMKVLPGGQTHAFVVADQVAPDAAGHVQEEPAALAFAPGPQAVHGATPPRPKKPTAQTHVPFGPGEDPGGQALTHVAEAAPGAATAHRPETHSGPALQGWPTTLRQPCRATAKVAGGQAQLPVAAAHTRGWGHRQETDPRPEVAPLGQARQGGQPVLGL